MDSQLTEWKTLHFFVVSIFLCFKVQACMRLRTQNVPVNHHGWSVGGCNYEMADLLLKKVLQIFCYFLRHLSWFFLRSITRKLFATCGKKIQTDLRINGYEIVPGVWCFVNMPRRTWLQISGPSVPTKKIRRVGVLMQSVKYSFEK